MHNELIKLIACICDDDNWSHTQLMQMKKMIILQKKLNYINLH